MYGPPARKVLVAWIGKTDSPSTYQEQWLKGRCSTRIEVVPEKLSGPTQFGEIHEAAVRGIERALGDRRRETALSLHLSPGKGGCVDHPRQDPLPGRADQVLARARSAHRLRPPTTSRQAVRRLGPVAGGLPHPTLAFKSEPWRMMLCIGAAWRKELNERLAQLEQADASGHPQGS